MGGMQNMNGMMGQGGINMGGMGGMQTVLMNPNAGMNMAMPGMNIGGNWANIYKNFGQNNNVNINNTVGPQTVDKINVIFKTTMGVITNVLIARGKTMSELIKTFLDNYICKRPDLKNNINNIQFKYGESLIYLYSNERTIRTLIHIYI